MKELGSVAFETVWEQFGPEAPGSTMLKGMAQTRTVPSPPGTASLNNCNRSASPTWMKKLVLLIPRTQNRPWPTEGTSTISATIGDLLHSNGSDCAKENMAGVTI